MLKKISKKITAVLLCLCTLFSIVTFSVSAAVTSGGNVSGVAAAAVKPNVWAQTAKTFSINKVFSTGLSICGTALVKIAGATDCEGFQKAASIINKWVCGGSDVGQTLAEIESLCNEILNEVKLINQHLTDYDSEIKATLQDIEYKNAKTALDNQWYKDVTVFENVDNVGNTLQCYMDYMETAQLYTNGEADIDDIEACQKALYKNYCEVYKAAGNSFGDKSDDEIRDTIFCDDTVDGVFYRAIESMSNALNNTSNYADAAAQFAYTSLPFSGDQYNYIISSIDKQYMEIISMEMMYQEFIAERGDYFEEKYKDDAKKWELYQKWTDALNDLNQKVAKDMNKMLDREVLLYSSSSSSISLKLDEFVKSEDFATVNLKNTSYLTKFDSYEYEEPVIKGFDCDSTEQLINNYSSVKDFATYHKVTTDYMKYNRVAVPAPRTDKNPTGIDIYYILESSQFGTSEDSVPEKLRMYNLDYKENSRNMGDTHWPNCDFFNLTRGDYSDGLNSFSCANSTSDFHSLFATGLFSALLSTPANYINNYLIPNNGQKNIKTYIILPNYDFDPPFWVWETGYETFYGVDTTAQQPGSNLEVSAINGSVIQPDKPAGSTSAYTTILTNNNGYYNTKVDTAVSGTGGADFYMISEDGNRCTSDTLSSGQDITFKFKPNDDTVLEGITVQRHNDYADPKKITGEDKILTKDDISSLPVDDDGYYTFTYPAPFSNATFVLDTKVGYRVYIDGNPKSDGNIVLDSYVNLYAEGDTVDFFVTGDIQSVGYYEGDVYKRIDLKKTLDGDVRGSFVMPAHDITLFYDLTYDGHLYDDNGFCVYCGDYQPAYYNKSTGNYEIGNAGQMFWFASLVNGDSSHADISEKEPRARGVLTSDIYLEEREWKPIEDYMGVFDGQGHTISGFKINNVDSDTGFFKSLSYVPPTSVTLDIATIKNFTLVGEINAGSTSYAVGGVVGTSYEGIIERVNSYVNINCGTMCYVGGIVGRFLSPSTLQECTYHGDISLDFDFFGAGGLVGAIDYNVDEDHPGINTIKDCANYGSITFNYVEGEVSGSGTSGGIVGMINIPNKNLILSDCYSYGSFVIQDQSYLGAITGFLNAETKGIQNCYYLDTTAEKPFRGEDNTEIDDTLAIPKTAEQFASGEVAYLLNRAVTDGSQVWYQNIDNGKTPDIYPVLDNTHGTVYLLSDGGYSNFDGKPEEFDMDKDGNLLIKTYDDLVKLSRLVREDYKVYGSQSYVLANNIIAPADSEWTMGIGSVDEDKPFNGTFDGNGYIIVGFNVNCPKYGGLFEEIGSKGKVSNLIFVDCDYNANSETAGSIAAVNNGTVDHCLSGLNLTTGTIFIDINGDGVNEKLSLSQFNSDIKGNISGGLVAVNNGSIIGSRNASIVSGTDVCGGISGVNTGLIYGCANTGSIGASNTKNSGGISGKNGNTIKSSYNAGKVNGASKTNVGSVAGINGYDEFTDVTVEDTFYTTANGLLSIGTESLVELSASNSSKTKTELHSEEFTDELNKVSNDYDVSWIRNEKLNNGYPTIKCDFYKMLTKTSRNGISVTGYMHNSLNINYTSVSNTTAFDEYADGMDIISAYSAQLTDNNGNEIPAELWMQGKSTVKVPVPNDKAKLLLLDSDGNVTSCDYKYEDGNAVFTTEGAPSFAFVFENGSVNSTSDTATVADGTVSTGGSFVAVAVLALVSVCALMTIAYSKRRKDD